MNLTWMAWTWPTAIFFITIAVLIASMGVWEYFVPGGAERFGVLGIQTTRGDRLFISLLGAAYINLAWLGFVGPTLWWALAISVVYAIFVFRWV
jgi:predicted small integral membrane protein